MCINSDVLATGIPIQPNYSAMSQNALTSIGPHCKRQRTVNDSCLVTRSIWATQSGKAKLSLSGGVHMTRVASPWLYTKHSAATTPPKIELLQSMDGNSTG